MSISFNGVAYFVIETGTSVVLGRFNTRSEAAAYIRRSRQQDMPRREPERENSARGIGQAQRAYEAIKELVPANAAVKGISHVGAWLATGGIESGKIVAGATVKIPDRVLCPLLQGWAWHTSPRCRRDGERTAVYGYLGAGETAPPFFPREAAARACLHNSYAERRVEQTPRKGLPADFPRAFFATRAFRRGAFNVQTLGGV